MKKVLSNKYEIIEKIGGGGMASVYKGKQKDLQRVVAIKIPREAFISDSLFIQRFMREARSMARLNHENITHIYDVGKDNDTPYIIMEYGMEHEEVMDLQSLLTKEGRLGPEKTARITIQIASALCHAHRRGVIHRDIKPGNILVLASGKIKVTDFGIASAAGESTITSSEQILGTPEYMSSEQVRGNPVNPGMDLYSLGMVMYKMLTGRTPFDGDSKMTIIGKLMNEKHKIPLIFSEETPDNLKAIIIRLLKRDAQKRYPDAESLIEDIEKFLKPKITMPQTHRRSGPQLVTRVVGIGAIILVLISIIIWFALGNRDIYKEVRTLQGQMLLMQAEAIRLKESSAVVMVAEYAPDRYKAGITYMKEADILNREIQSTIADEDYDSARDILTRIIAYYKSAETEFNQGQKEAEMELNDARNRASRLMTQVISIQEEAALSGAKKLAASTFQNASDIFLQGKKAFIQGDYGIAKANLNQAVSGFKKAKEAALEAAGKQRIARQKPRADKPKSHRKDAALSVSKPPKYRKSQKALSHEDIKEVKGLFNSFNVAYKKEDIETLKNLSNISSSKMQSLEQFFDNYSAIDITLGKIKTTGNTANTILSIVSLTDNYGNQVLPGKAWKDIPLTIRHGKKGWEKIKW